MNLFVDKVNLMVIMTTMKHLIKLSTYLPIMLKKCLSGLKQISYLTKKEKKCPVRYMPA